MITILRPDQAPEIIRGNMKPNLTWLQDKVEGWIESIIIDDERQMFVNENGLQKRMPVNETATQIYRESLSVRYKLPQSELNRVFILGPAVILEGKSRVD